jgi:hypothetical protein
MRRTILLSLFALLAVGVVSDACAQRRGGGGFGYSRGGGHGFGRARGVSPYGIGYGYLPFDSGYGYSPYDSGSDYLPYDTGSAYAYGPPPPFLAQPPAPPVVQPPVHPVITEYKWPAGGAASPPSEAEPEAFAIVLKNGSTLSAVAVFASDDGLHYVDPDERHLRVSMSEVDRGATLKINRARNLSLYLPAAQ